MAFLTLLKDAFVGVPQSKYAGMAILVALLSVAVAMLVGKDSLPLGQKFLVIVLMFLIALPGLLLSLFQLTCLVTGATPKSKWCGWYAWIGTAIAFIYSLVIVTVAVLSIMKGTDVQTEMSAMGVEGFEAEKKEADAAAAEYFKAMEAKAKEAGAAAGKAVAPKRPEGFEDMPPAAPEAPMEEPKKPAEDAMAPAPEMVLPAEPETFTTCGAPLF